MGCFASVYPPPTRKARAFIHAHPPPFVVQLLVSASARFEMGTVMGNEESFPSLSVGRELRVGNGVWEIIRGLVRKRLPPVLCWFVRCVGGSCYMGKIGEKIIRMGGLCVWDFGECFLRTRDTHNLFGEYTYNLFGE